MSLFDDDFYTTKLPRRTRWTHDGSEFPSVRRSKNSTAAVVTIAGAAAALMLGTLLIGIGSHRDNPDKLAAVPVMSTGNSYQFMEDQVVRAVEQVKPAVVSILSAIKEEGAGNAQSLGIGSGVLFRKDGDKAYIVTNNHVVQSASQIEVILANGEHRKGKLKGRDMITDLAVVEIDSSGIQSYAEFGDSEKLKAGQTAIAIGSPLGLRFAQTTTVGVISSPHQKVPISFAGDGNYDWEMDVIQTDAAINQGNSGGALVNLEGKLIGINSMKVAEKGVEGLGFAIPINSAKETIDSLLKYGKVKRPYMGLTTEPLRAYKGTEVLKLPDSVKNGLIVIDAIGPAKTAGLATNDVITELDGKPVYDNITLRQYLYGSKKIGDSIKVTYYRAGKKATATIELGEKKED
ncbi:PDZ domain-containing protein [Paenibacillus mesophilus]|uniref:S1C family serine protease n=1 Tax=Paenibacillus mesophilus TaxID=2582849 RepID=UPI00110D8E6B|nr:trypsin-like peptidase domain-containing protein [Paenibacillus mesophilus]TMV48002.1 PDZ domain-containing protein [Paenibacillus mesophilus]